MVVPIYKNMGDIQNYSNYRGIKLMIHTMKLWDGVIERRLRNLTIVSKNQFGFMPSRSTTEGIFLLRQVIERYKEEHKSLHIAFIDLEKAYDRVPKFGDCLGGRKCLNAMSISIRICMKDCNKCLLSGGMSNEFSILVGLHQGSTLSPYLFALVMDELTRHL